MITDLPPELIAAIGEHVTDPADVKACFLAHRCFAPLLHNKTTLTSRIARDNMVTVEGVDALVRRQPGLETVKLQLHTLDMTEEEVGYVADIVECLCFVHTVRTVSLLFPGPVDFTKFFANNSFAHKCNLLIYLVQQPAQSAVPCLSFPVATKFKKVSLHFTDAWHAHCAFMFPTCDKLVLFKDRTSMGAVFEISFEAVDPDKTSVFVLTGDMHLCIKGSRAVRYLVCDNMFVAPGPVYDLVTAFYREHPMEHLEEMVVTHMDMGQTHRFHTFGFYGLVPYMKAKKYIVKGSCPPMVIPFLRHIHAALDVPYERVSFLCTNADECAISRICQIMVDPSLGVVTRQADCAALNNGFINSTLAFALDDEVKKELAALDDVRELLGRMRDEAHVFAWSPVTSAIDQCVVARSSL